MTKPKNMVLVVKLRLLISEIMYEGKLTGYILDEDDVVILQQIYLNIYEPEKSLTPSQFEILDHTEHRAANNNFCGDSNDMQELVAQGLMRSVGFVPGVSDEYFKITALGRKILLDK